MNPAFSIIVRTCNRPEFLDRCLRSIAAQDFQDFEVVLVNDGGEPVTLNPPFALKTINDKRNMGRPYALNAGLKAATGKCIAFLDDDDVYLPNHLSTVYEALERGNHVVYTDTIRVCPGRRELGSAQDYFGPLLYFENWISPSHLALSREAVEATGEFDTAFLAYEDWDYLVRLSERFTFKHIPVPTVEMHFHEGNVTGTSFACSYRPLFMAKHKRNRRRQLAPHRLLINILCFLKVRITTTLRHWAFNHALVHGIVHAYAGGTGHFGLNGSTVLAGRSRKA